MKISNTQIDRLGNRLRSKEVSDADLQLLNDYRLSFAPAYETVVKALRNTLNLEPTGRPAKSTMSIVDKLKRESLRLRQMQDIAGCRVVVGDVMRQDAVVADLIKVFAETSVVDRRITPSYGYRAVHVVVRRATIPVEIQVRTELQHGWAQLPEKLSDIVDPSVKYGGGPELLKETLLSLSELIAAMERLEATAVRRVESHSSSTDELYAQLHAQIVKNKNKIKDILTRMIKDAYIWDIK
jgi:putative GTP pyrophosphokinase